MILWRYDTEANRFFAHTLNAGATEDHELMAALGTAEAFRLIAPAIAAIDQAITRHLNRIEDLLRRHLGDGEEL